ncbi:MAG: 4-hydroxythreonine-4-phosphate dehydrogenase PdxA, partial [Gammaproteobacteria bacterium]|nr:4-hydroxythreonine-4-phosphate dehydrogenase PdxA [Gammaproteobacteria bacterium]
MNRIVVSAGEPGGIGPDLCLQFAMQAFPAQWVAAGDPNLFAQRATLLGLRLDIKRWTPDSPVQAHQAGTLQVWDVVRTPNNTVGAALAANAHYVLDVLRLSTQACLDQVFDALVTGPVQKSSINEAGIPFSGHTEYLAELTNTDQPVMMLATEGLRVALLTTHVPIAEVPKLITRDRMESVVKILHHDLRENFGVENPRILVCGLNPHAGEDGIA